MKIEIEKEDDADTIQNKLLKSDIIPLAQPEEENLDFKKGKNSQMIVYEFKIDGMTCVACSGAIERGLTIEFKGKGLV